MSDLDMNTVEDDDDILAALPATAQVRAVRLKDGIVSQLFLSNGTILTGAMVVQTPKETQ